ncbi:exo-alpha-sialidase [Dactylosporangium fulvum]|uniref:exo-alpha-sialidase n=1 Tax=Dactylosporangium fulvum TaxID=53359 RepID=A0ABY5W0R2_9ACTN|nr:exo-alpha-sialidase [Dactylosporangium fulvum]UWP83112.1 exo-alpha-sialidase [Dactylosporangium fulvum]
MHDGFVPSPQLPDDPQPARPDPRLLTAGSVIQADGYCDQPYVVVAGDGAWVCVVTSSNSHEGDPSQRIVSRRSTDQGATWSDPVDVEPPTGPEASWAVPLVLPSGRIYVFYTYNSRNLRVVITDSGTSPRVDTLGDLVFKYSDDHGRSWSADRYTVPMRLFDIDRANPYGGEVLFWWSVGKPEIVGDAVYLGASKVGGFREERLGFQRTSEGFVMRSDNLLTEPDPTRITWTTLPDGEVGLRAPAGEVAEEHKVVGLTDGSLYCTYRTEVGVVAEAYSRDGGHTWTPPRAATFAATGRPIRNPRAATFAWNCGGGRYLLWFHHNGNTWFGTYRNPVWLSGGVEVDGVIHWSEPEIALYADDPQTSMSYPDLIQDGDGFWLTETQKSVARVHRIEPELLDGLWSQHVRAGVPDDSLLLTYRAGSPPPGPVTLPRFQLRRGNWRIEDARAGFTLDTWLTVTDLTPGRTLVEQRDYTGHGFALSLAEQGRLRLTLNDGRRECGWISERDTLVAGRRTHVAVIVDGGPKLIVLVVDGRVQDGGDERPYGWGRFSADLRDLTTDADVRMHGVDRAEVGCLRVHGRPLRVSEAVAAFRAGPDAGP